MNNTMTIEKASHMTASVDDLVQWKMKLRATCINSITPEDMQAIVLAQVERAKKGDSKAIKFVMTLLSGDEVRVTNNIITDSQTAQKLLKQSDSRKT